MSHSERAISGGKVLFHYWRVPLVRPPQPDGEKVARGYAKFLALVVVVVLGFAIRGRARGAISAAAIPVVAAAIAGFLDSIVRQVFRRVHDGMILPIYVTTPLIMFGYLVGDTVLRQKWHWYQQHSHGHEFFFPISLSTGVIFLVLLLRSSFKAMVGPPAIVQGVVVALLSGLIVYFVAKMPAAYGCAFGICGTP